jgi:translation initiation factor IF-2
MTKDLEEVLEKRRIIEKVWTKVGEAVVKKVFDIKGVGIIAGCYMRDGVLSRDCKVSCVRNGQVVGESKINSLQRDRKTVKEVHAGFECGFVASSFSDWQEGDTVYCYSEVKSNK